jgi:hypothetical protein
MHDMIAVLDAFVYPGSELWLYNEARPALTTPPAHAACIPVCSVLSMPACSAL